MDDLTHLYKPHSSVIERTSHGKWYTSKRVEVVSERELRSSRCIWCSSPIVLLFAKKKALQPIHWRRMSEILVDQLPFDYNEFPSRSLLGCFTG